MAEVGRGGGGGGGGGGTEVSRVAPAGPAPPVGGDQVSQSTAIRSAVRTLRISRPGFRGRVCLCVCVCVCF